MMKIDFISYFKRKMMGVKKNKISKLKLFFVIFFIIENREKTIFAYSYKNILHKYLQRDDNSQHKSSNYDNQNSSDNEIYFSEDDKEYNVEDNLRKINTISLSSSYFFLRNPNKEFADIGVEFLNLCNLGLNISDGLFENKFLNGYIQILSNGFITYCSLGYWAMVNSVSNFCLQSPYWINFFLDRGPYKNLFSSLHPNNGLKKTLAHFDNFFACEKSNSFFDELSDSELPFDREKIVVKSIQDKFIKKLFQRQIPIYGNFQNLFMYFAERISIAIQDGKVNNNILSNLNYLFNKLIPLKTLLFPPEDMLSLYNVSDINIYDKDFNISGGISFLSGFIHCIKNMFFYEKMKNSVWEKIILPDIFTYKTSHGISYKFVGGYQLRRMSSIRFGIESVLHGKNKNEFSLDVFHRFDYRLKPELASTITLGSGGFNLLSSFAFFPINFLRLSCGISIYSINSLFGERNTIWFINKEKASYNDAKNEYLKALISDIATTNTKEKFLSSTKKVFSNEYITDIWIGISFAF